MTIIDLNWLLKANVFCKGCTGITLWTPWTIYVIVASGLPKEAQERILRHELVHVEQIQDDGIIIFLMSYIYQYITKGYENIDYEIAARRKER